MDPFASRLVIETAYSWISSLAFSPNGSILAGGGALPNMGVLWDTRTGQEIMTLPPHVAPVRSLAFSPDGTLIACASGNFDSRSVMPNEIVLSEVATGRTVATLASGRESFTSIAFNADGKSLAGGSFAQQNGLRLWDMTTRSAVGPLEGYAAEVHAVAFSPDGRHIAAGCGDGIVRVWDSATRTQVLIWDNRSGPIYTVAWSPEGTRIAAGSDARAGITLWNVTNGSVDRVITTPPYCTAFSLAFNPDGKTLIGGLGDDHDKTGAVIMWDIVTGDVRRTLFNNIESPDERDGVIYAVTITKDGRTLAAGGGDGTIFLWSVA
jgi:dipeptidyl aminopeptidase/acylaminoacyl peptidase